MEKMILLRSFGLFIVKIIMSTENNTANSSPPEVKLGWNNGTEVTIKRKRYQVTEEQFQAILERKIEKKLTESLSFQTDEEKLAFIKPGAILTFKTKIPGFQMGQIAIAKIQRTKAGKIKLTNPFGTETPWFESDAELLQSVDWDWMQQNIITKDEIE
jgi:hypothetical protein